MSMPCTIYVQKIVIWPTVHSLVILSKTPHKCTEMNTSGTQMNTSETQMKEVIKDSLGLNGMFIPATIETFLKFEDICLFLYTNQGCHSQGKSPTVGELRNL